MMPVTQTTIATALFLCLTACDAKSPKVNATEVQPSLILTVIQSGGCIRMGPNCSIHTLYSDGTVEAARNTGEPNPPVELTANIDKGLTESWVMAVQDEDFNVLREALPEGQCAGCFDGVDLEYIINTGTDTETFSSIEYKFDTAFSFFSTTADVYRAMAEAAPLKLQRR